jgi:tripartite-type tricarboxylate transporter receptor subunit TctC
LADARAGRRAVLALLAGIAAAASAPGAAAQGFPTKPIRFIVASAAGGGADITARAIAQRLGPALGQNVIVDNRPGAGGSIGLEIAARSAPDGHTVNLLSAAHTVAVSMRRGLPYDPVRDFAPISQMTAQAYVLVTHPGVGVASVRELVALAKERATGLTYGSSGPGGLSHLAGALLGSTTGTKLIHVPYKGGGPALADVLSGQLDMLFAAPLETAQHIKLGRVRALAVSSAGRSKAFPELPSLAEAGVPGYEVSGWYGLVAPAATAPVVIDRLNRELVRVLQLPDVVEYFAKDGIDAAGTTPGRFATHLRAEVAKWKKVVDAAGIAIDR